MEFLSYLISGISLGSIYAIIALGYTMVYGIAKMLNFAHGDIIMIGGYVSFCSMYYLNLPPIVATLLAVIACTVLGIVIERLAYAPLRSAPSLAVLITAIGVSYFLQNSALLIWKAAAKTYPPVVTGAVQLFNGQLTISYISLLTIAACVVIMLALTTFVSKSKMGKAMRACSEDKGAAQLMGINVNSTISATFAIGSALAAIAGVLLAVVVCTVLGVVIEGLAYKPLRQASSLAVLITAIGVSYFLQNAALLLWGADPKVFTPVIPEGSLPIEGVNITYVALVTVLACIIIMLALTWFTSKTKMGKAMRACSEDKAAAQLMGINVNRTISMTFAIGSALAAIAGVLLCSSYRTLMPTTGSLPGIKAFTAAVFGGIGSIPGAMLGGILLGIIETFAKVINTNISDAVVFAVLIIVLLVKPAGLLGKTVREKV